MINGQKLSFPLSAKRHTPSFCRTIRRMPERNDERSTAVSLSFRNLISILPPDALWSCSNAGSRLYGIKRVSRDDRVVFTQDSLYVLSYSDYRKAGPTQIPNALIYSRDPITREDLPAGVNAIVLYRKDEIERISE